MKGIDPDDFASMEMLLPGEWKKTHPESYRNRYVSGRTLSLIERQQLDTKSFEID